MMAHLEGKLSCYSTPREDIQILILIFNNFYKNQNLYFVNGFLNWLIVTFY